MSGSAVRTAERKVRVVTARVIHVDRVRFSVDLRDENGGEHSGVSCMPSAMGEAGSGDAYLPEVNSLVYLLFPSSGVPFILGGVSSPRAPEDGSETGADFRQNRPVLNEGDRMFSTQDGNFIILRRGGVLEMGASQTSKRLFLPTKSFIRDFAQNYEMVTSGGVLSWQTRDEDASHGADLSPVEFSLDVKEFAQEDPCIKIRLGRIQAEDGSALPNAGDSARIVASIDIDGRFRLWLDREGNVASYTHGATVASYNGPVTVYAHEGLTLRVRGMLTEHFRGRRTVVDEDVVEELNGSVTRTVAQDLRETVGGVVERAAAAVTETVVGSVSRTVGGTETLTLVSNRAHTLGGSDSLSAAEHITRSAGGTYALQVANGLNAAVGLLLQLEKGELRVHTPQGSCKMGVGPSISRLLGSLSIATNGDVDLASASGNVSVKLNSSGILLKTPRGEIAMDAAGNVSLGPGGPKGAVVTTLTHPVDYVTGAPILGASQVSAGGAPSPTAIPPTVTS